MCIVRSQAGRSPIRTRALGREENGLRCVQPPVVSHRVVALKCRNAACVLAHVFRCGLEFVALFPERKNFPGRYCILCHRPRGVRCVSSVGLAARKPARGVLVAHYSPSLYYHGTLIGCEALLHPSRPLVLFVHLHFRFHLARRA